MDLEINNFFKHQKGFFKDIETFKTTELCKYYESFFGELVYTEDKDVCFIGVDQDGNFYDEIYYPCNIQNKIGTLAPKIFIKNKTKPSLIWKDVATKGYAILDCHNFNEINKKLILNDTYFGKKIKPDFDVHETMLLPFYAENIMYDDLTNHFEPPYVTATRHEALDIIKKTNPNLNTYTRDTSDVIKYIYLPEIPETSHGPYSFHFDYFEGLNFMFFIYLSKHPRIDGRELLIGKRPDFIDFKTESTFKKFKDKNLIEYEKIEIKDGMIILINSLNPIFHHAIERMKSENEIFLLTNYIWNKTK